MSNAPQPARAEMAAMYETMVTSRKYEDMIKLAYLEGKMPVFDLTFGPIPGEMHLSTGQEPCAVAVCTHLTKDDWVVAPHRPHHIAIAKGVDLDRMTAEIFGRETGLGGGRGGHMHLSDPDVGFTSTGIVGQAIGIANGHALAAQMQKSGAVSVGYIGEGGANQGLFHETMNLAALWNLPLICVIEDNRWGVSVAKEKSTAIARNSDRAVAYGCAGEHVADNDVWAIYEATHRAVARARAGEGPTILEIETIRLEGHFIGDTEEYVPQAERDSRKDPITVMGDRMMGDEGFTQSDLDEMQERAGARVVAAEKFARDSAVARAEDALTQVFVSAA